MEESLHLMVKFSNLHLGCRKKKKWKCKLLGYKKKGIRKHLGIRPKNLKPLVDWQDETNINVESLKTMSNVGNRVKMRNNEWGVVKYVGRTKLSKDINTKMIGLELDRWSSNANNGIVKPWRYFTSKDGRGYFTTRKHLVENVGTIYWSTGTVCLQSMF